jgi:hypothetical protein
VRCRQEKVEGDQRNIDSEYKYTQHTLTKINDSINKQTTNNQKIRRTIIQELAGVERNSRRKNKLGKKDVQV